MSELVDRFIHKYGRLPTEVDPDYLEMLRMSKYRILVCPDVNPAKCANCGSSKKDGRNYIDFGLQVDWYGAVFLCGLCLHDIAKAMGLFKVLEDQLRLTVDSLAGFKCLQGQGELLHEKLVQIFKEFETYYASLHTLRDDSSSDISSYVGPDETNGESAGLKSEPTITEPKPKPAKSAPSSRSKNISSLAELLESNT